MKKKEFINFTIFLGLSIFMLSPSSSFAVCSRDASEGSIQCHCKMEGPDPINEGTFWARAIPGSHQGACDDCAVFLSEGVKPPSWACKYIKPE